MIIAVNTATPQFGIALLEKEGTVLAEHFMAPAAKNFGDFMPAMDFLLTRSRAKLRAIEALAVSTGPGSFTGLRVGLSAAKGMAEALGVPIIGVSTLEALASQFPFSPYPVCPLLNSRKGEVFAALFGRCQDQGLVRRAEDRIVKFEDLPSFSEGATLFVGTDYRRQAPQVRSISGPEGLLAPAPFWNLRASLVGALGLERVRKGDVDEVRDLAPSYLKPPDIRSNPLPPGTGAPEGPSARDR